LNREITALYQKEGVNPFAGCITLLIQIPILWALFYLFAKDEYNHGLFKDSYFLGVHLTTPSVLKSDPNLPLTLSLKSIFPHMATDVYLYLPSLFLVILYILSTVLFQKQVQRVYSQGPQQGGFNTNFLLGLIIVIGFIFPAGVLLYFITSNLITMAQQAVIIRQLETLEKKKKGVMDGETDPDTG
jgi:YidC/Oxa1 family membrane protein insertase